MAVDTVVEIENRLATLNAKANQLWTIVDHTDSPNKADLTRLVVGVMAEAEELTCLVARLKREG